MDSSAILTTILIIIGVSYLLGELLSFLNLKHHSPTLPALLQGRYDQEKYAKSHEYHQVNYRFSLFKGLLSFVITF